MWAPLWLAQTSNFPISPEGVFGGAVLVGVIVFLQFWVIPRLLEAKQEIIELQSARIEVLTKRADDLTEAVKSSSARDEAAIQQGATILAALTELRRLVGQR